MACVTLNHLCFSCFPAEPLWHVPAQARLSTIAGSSGSKHVPRQDAAGKDSPNRHSKVSLGTPTPPHPRSQAFRGCQLGRPLSWAWPETPWCTSSSCVTSHSAGSRICSLQLQPPASHPGCGPRQQGISSKSPISVSLLLGQSWEMNSSAQGPWDSVTILEAPFPLSHCVVQVLKEQLAAYIVIQGPGLPPSCGSAVR